jgi:hypothetical protein
MRSSPLAPTLLAIALSAGVTVASAAGQAGGPPTPTKPVETATRVFAVRHVDARHVASVLEIYGGAARPQTDLRVVAWGGPADRLAAVEATVAALDVAPQPARDLLLTVWLVAASQQQMPGQEPPATVGAAISSLSDPSKGRYVRLLDRALLRVRENNYDARIRGLFSGLASGSGSYELRIHHLALQPGSPSPIVRLDGLAFEIATPVPASTGESEHGLRPAGSLSTDLDLVVDSTVVVGATPLGAAGESLLLVLHAAIAD